MDLGLTDRVFVVTAASSGLGLASAEALMAEGARCVLVARRAEVLDELVERYGADLCVGYAGDLTDASVASGAVDAAMERFGRVDGALISVGGPMRGGVLDITDEQWLTAFGQVFVPALRVARAVVAAAAPDVRLGFVLSSSVKNALPTMAPSNGLRPGLAMLIKQLADELGPTGGRAVGLMPGSIATERLMWLFDQSDDPDATRRVAEEEIPLRRLGRPEEFGRIAAFALSDAASYLTGSVIAVDGGRLRSL